MKRFKSIVDDSVAVTGLDSHWDFDDSELICEFDLQVENWNVVESKGRGFLIGVVTQISNHSNGLNQTVLVRSADRIGRCLLNGHSIRLGENIRIHVDRFQHDTCADLCVEFSIPSLVRGVALCSKFTVIDNPGHASPKSMWMEFSFSSFEKSLENTQTVLWMVVERVIGCITDYNSFIQLLVSDKDSKLAFIKLSAATHNVKDVCQGTGSY